MFSESKSDTFYMVHLNVSVCESVSVCANVRVCVHVCARSRV